MITLVRSLRRAMLPAEQPPPVPEPAPAGCTGKTKAGKPCGGRPGADGRCAAHKEGT
jgi:hypothetical protein